VAVLTVCRRWAKKPTNLARLNSPNLAKLEQRPLEICQTQRCDLIFCISGTFIQARDVSMRDTSSRLDANDERDPVVSDRRAAERFRCEWRPAVGFIARAKSLTTNRGSICDVSCMGIGLITENVVEPGTFIAIQLRKKRNGFSGLISAKVIRAVPQDDGSFFLGCLLSRRLSETELEALQLPNQILDSLGCRQATAQ
jgi:hypothetical protein